MQSLQFFLNSFFRLVIREEYAFGRKGHEEFKIPSKATVEYTVTLKEFKRVTDPWKFRAKDSFDEATRVKNKATEFLKQEKYLLAIKLYERANTYRITRKLFFLCFIGNYSHFYKSKIFL